MAGQIIFFEKNKMDFADPNVAATASQAPTFADLVLNRNNYSAWITTGSVDADNTTLEVDMVDTKQISEILLVKHNFKSFKVEYWDGAAYQAFSPAINETTNAVESNWYTVAAVTTSKLRITIYGTQTANEDKVLTQFIATEKVGQLTGWPVIKNPKHGTNKQSTKMLSGKLNIVRNVGAFSCQLEVKNWRTAADLVVVESLYDSLDGFLVWLCGGVTTQFASSRKGYRFEDLYLMGCSNDYEPEYYKGMYQCGMDITMSLTEVIG